MKNNYYWLYCRFSYRFFFIMVIVFSSQFLTGASWLQRSSTSAGASTPSPTPPATPVANPGANAGANQPTNPIIFNMGRDFVAGATSGIDSDAAAAFVGTVAARASEKATERVLGGVGQGLQTGFAEDSDLSQGMTLAGDSFVKGIDKVVLYPATKFGGIVVATAAGYFVVQCAIPMAFRMIERALTRPKLIIESSNKTMVEYIQSLFSPKAPQAPMVFSPMLEARLNKIVRATSTINTKLKEGKTNVKYRNLMLYGPPGTGKTMFATELAKRSGMEYASMSGSSFSKFKDGEGIQALDELFAWANRSKGLLIFVDEAETFLSKRENMDPQSKAYQLLNNFLNYTGTRSNKFMLVFATNHKDALDSAMYRRIDDLIQMPLPGRDARIRILNLYKDKILMDGKQNGKQFVTSVIKVLTQAKIEAIADKTKGLSAGDLEGIINSIKTDTDIMDPAVVTPELVDTIVSQAVEKHIAFTGGIPLGEIED